MTALIYPIAGGWEWNGGWLNDVDGYFFNVEFIDFAGSSIVHGVGGFAAFCCLHGWTTHW
jgi:Amt family ammonium transporter